MFTGVTTSGCIYNVKNGIPKIVFEGAPEGHLEVVAHPFKEVIIVAGKVCTLDSPLVHTICILHRTNCV